MALRPWRLLSLCAGVGGLDLGVRLADPEARTVCYVEREAPAAAIMVARMEEGWLHPAPVWSDLASFDAGAWDDAVDCVVSGDPCQPNSVAGRGLGDSDDRWLADRVVDVFDRSGATRLFRENVTGNADGQLAYFVPALERLGCRVAVGIFSAKQLGFAHGRERLFIMADRDSEPGRLHARRRHDEAETQRRCPRVDDAERTERRADSQPRDCQGQPLGSRGWHESTTWLGASSEDLADADRARSTEVTGDDGKMRGVPEAQCQSEHGSALSRRGSDYPLLTPRPNDPRWPDIIARAPHLEPAVRRVADGMADRVDRLRACGNGVVPLVAGYAWRTLEARLAAAGAGELAVRTAA